MAGRQAAPDGAGRGHQAKPRAARGGRGRGRGRGRGGGRGRGAGRRDDDGANANATARKVVPKNNAMKKEKSPLFAVGKEDSSASSATASTAGTPPGTSAGLQQEAQQVDAASISITNSLNQFACHMQSINETIGDAMSSAAANGHKKRQQQKQQCPTCIQTSQTLQKLQSQTTIGLNCLQQMTTALEQLMVQTRLATSALDQIRQMNVNDATATLVVQDELNNATNANESSPAMNGDGNAGVGGNDNTGSATSHSQPSLSSVSVSNQNTAPSDRGSSNNHPSQTMASQTTSVPKLSTSTQLSKATPSSTPSSYHTTSSQLSSSTNTNTNQTSSAAALVSPATLSSIISSRSQYLTGPPSIYTAWLQTELDIETPSDLLEAIEDCPELLEVGNGVVGIKRGLMGAFCRAVQGAVVVVGDVGGVASSGEDAGIVDDGARKQPPLPVENNQGGDDIVMSTVNAVLQEKEETAEQPQQWICPSCKVQFCKQFPKCPVCGAKPPVDQMQWTCSDCNMVNSNDAWNCTVCRSPAPDYIQSQNREQKMRVREKMARQAQLEQEREYERARAAAAAERERLEPENAKRQAEIEREQERAWEEQKRVLAQQAEAERARMAHQARLDAEEADRENERKREELRAKDRAREEQKRLAKEARLAKAAEKARQEELEREETEEERRRLEQAKKEKMAALERHGTTVVKAPSVSSLSSATPSFQPNIPKGVVSIGASSSNQNAKTGAAGMKAPKNSSSKSVTTSSNKVTKAQRKPAFVRKTNRLSYYIKNYQDSADNISPVFSLLQNEKTLERGRKLLLLECQAKEQRSLIDELIKKRASDEAVLNKITSEEESFVESWKSREPSLKKRIELERKKIEKILSGADKSRKEREDEILFNEKKKTRASGMSELQGRINAIERGISNKAHADAIDQLKVSSKKLNEALAKIETQSTWSLFSQDKNEVILYEKEVYARLRELGIDTEAGHWNLGKVGDNIGKELMATTKKREQCMSIINGIRDTIDKKRDASQTLSDDRLGRMDEISAAKKIIADESKWSTKVEKMREAVDTLRKEVEKINEDSSDDDSAKLLDCIKCLEGLADDGVYWPEKQTKIKETIAGLKNFKEGGSKEPKKAEEDKAAGIISLIKDIEKRMEDGNAVVEKSKVKETGELSATLGIIQLETKDIEEKMQQSKKSTGIFAKMKGLLTDDERTKLEKRKKHLVEQAKACTDLIAARKAKANIEEKRQYINEEITQSQEKVRQVEKDVASLNDEIFSHVKTFSAITNEIDWEAAAKPFVIALYSKIRELQEKLDKDKADDLRLEEAYQQKLQREGRDEKSKQAKIQAMQRDVTGFERDLVTGAQRVKEGPGKIGDQREVVDANNPKINAAKKLLNENLHDITNLKPPGSVYDESFHIDETRDGRGYTFLMVASTNDDVETAQICLDWGASPHVVNPEGLTAADYSYFFGFDRITKLILEHRGSLPQKQVDAMGRLCMSDEVNAEINWTESLKVAETASIPAETLPERPEELEQDENKRMTVLSEADRISMDFTCFEARLLDENIASDRVRRVVFLNGEVYNYLLTCDSATASHFIGVLEGLKPARVRKAGVKPTKIHRRSCVGTAGFEVIAASFRESNGFEKDALLTPFLSGEVEGVAQIGVIVWAICSDNEASLYKTLIASTEFMRHKVEMDDRFLPHKSSVLEIGRDMHLLDLHSTSIWTTSTMDLFILNVDEGDLDRIQDPGFSAKKRIVYSEQIVNRAIFRASETEAIEDEGILAAERVDKSAVISGGAGTGKTLLMIKKVSKEDPSLRILVVSRLPRLVNIVKAAVESFEERSGDGAGNVSFTTYDELFQVLARRVVPDEDQDYKSFVRFDHVRYDCDEDSGVSFLKKFVNPLGERTKKQMVVADIEPLTLWFAIITVKTHARCVATKMPLTLDEYLLLPPTFGLTSGQRQLCYELFTKYQEWCAGGPYWDEADRSLYVIKYGPSVYRDKTFVPWAERVNQRGETNLLDEEGNPLYPFFQDLVAADEAQDFTELDIAIFVRMSSLRSCFINTDPAQSVEVGVKLREGTVNDVFYSQINEKGVGVKDVLQSISLKTNHRTHAQNLALGTAIRRTLARSFKLPIVEENALINGQLPSLLRIQKLKDLADSSKFRGANIVFLCPDAMVHDIRSLFREQNMQNDVFGVVEAKGLEFDSCALLGFFTYFEQKGTADQWMNCLRWLSSSAGITNTSPTNELISGKYLEDCDYTITHPEVSDQAMMLYTALTRARNRLIIIEADIVHTAKSKKSKGRVKLADFAYRRLTELSLAKTVSTVDEGQTEMSPAQHKARGVLLVTQALSMIAAHEPFDIVRKKFLEAEARFAPSTGNDIDLLKKCKRHLKALEAKRELVRYAKTNFFVKGEYNLEGKFAEILFFGQSLGDFISRFAGDSFLQDEVKDVKSLVEEIFADTPYEFRFRPVYET